MASLSNPIFQHSSESEKYSPIAMQAAINEDVEQRRRLLDIKGETKKIILAKEVSQILEASGPTHLNPTPFDLPTEPLVHQAQVKATTVISSVLESGKNILQSASSATGVAAEKITTAASSISTATLGVVDSASHVALDTASALSHATADVAGYVQQSTKSASNFLSHKAQDAVHQASELAGKVAQSSSHAAEAVSQKSKQIVEGVTDKAHEVADNISHFTTLVSVLAAEETERARRLVSGDEARAAENAFRVSELVKSLGPDFYRQEAPNSLYGTKLLEEMERNWRLSSNKTAISEVNAHNIGKIVSGNMQSFMPRYQWVRAHICTLEEKERSRRLYDTNEAYAMLNAFACANLIRDLGNGFFRQGDFNSSYATTLLEEGERRNRNRAFKQFHAEENAHQLLDAVANNFEVLNYNTRNAVRIANEYANKLGNITLQAAHIFSNKTKELAQTAAQRVRAVAGDVAHFTAIMYIVALEEKERARRLSDPSEAIAINNAWKQSSLIRDLGNGFYKSTSTARFPSWILEELERNWRVATPANLTQTHSVASIVHANSAKFESLQQRSAEVIHARETAAHSRLNPNAPEFVPTHTVKLDAKTELAPIRSNLAAGAQL